MKKTPNPCIGCKDHWYAGRGCNCSDPGMCDKLEAWLFIQIIEEE